jgi:holo-[acyl-carrier protein] synthase
MIVSIGIDVCSVSRMRGVLERWGDRFWNRLLSEPERAAVGGRADRALFLASRFAAKEAAAKALAGGPGVGWHEVQVHGRPRRPPELRLIGEARALADRMGVTHTHLSITHDADVAAAVVIFESLVGERLP